MKNIDTKQVRAPAYPHHRIGLTVVVVAGVIWSGDLREEQEARRQESAAEQQPDAPTQKLQLEQVADMDLFELKTELRRRGHVHPRGDVRRLRAALERMIRTEGELAVAKQHMLPPCSGELTVSVRSCEDLMPGTSGDTANPFVVMSMGTDSLWETVVKKRTAAQPKTLNPEYGEDFQFTVPEYSEAPENETEAQMQARVQTIAAECTLSVAVWDAPNRILDAPCFLGEVKVDLVREFGKEWLTQEISRAFKLADPDFKSVSLHRERRLKARGSSFQDQLELGYIDLAIRFRRKEQVKPWWLGGVEALDGVLDGVLDGGLAGLDLATLFQSKENVLEECDRTCPLGHELRPRVEDGLTPAIRGLLPPCDGTLLITVASCSNLLPTDSDDHCADPFVTVSLASKVQRTRTLKKTLQPAFDQTLEFKVEAKSTKPQDLVLSLTVFDADWGGLAANFIGEVEVDLCKMYRKRWLAGRLSKALHLRDHGTVDEPNLKQEAAVDERNKRQAMSLRPYGTVFLEFEFVPVDVEPDVEPDAELAVEDPPDAEPAEIQVVEAPEGSEPAAFSLLRQEAEMAHRSQDHSVPKDGQDEGTPPAPGPGEHILAQNTLPLRYCAECFAACTTGKTLWECAACGFVLCADCALKSKALADWSEADWSGLGKDSLTLRLNQAQVLATAQGLGDTAVLASMQMLISACEDSDIADEIVLQLRARVVEQVEKSKLASQPTGARMPMLSPAEARRRGLNSPSQPLKLVLPEVDEHVSVRLAALHSRLAAVKSQRRTDVML